MSDSYPLAHFPKIKLARYEHTTYYLPCRHSETSSACLKYWLPHDLCELSLLRAAENISTNKRFSLSQICISKATII